ncbi:MAG: hypothetical protein R3F22_07285 [Lysobacteraceae bacterium]
MPSHLRSLLLTLFLLSSGVGHADAANRDRSPSAAVARQIEAPASIAPRWQHALPASGSLSSVAGWHGGNGRFIVYASDTAGGRLRVLDGLSGEPAGEPADLQMAAPTALFVIDDLLLVVEQDARRVLALGLPGLNPLGSIGDGGLIRPVSLFARHTDVDRYLLYVGDDYDNEGRLPPDRDLNRRVKTYQVSLDRDAADASPDRVSAERIGQLGETAGEGVLHRVGALVGDPFYDHLLITERDRTNDSGLRVYGFAGKYRNARLDRGLFGQQASGLALRACGNGRGHWFATDATENSPILLMDRASLRPSGAFDTGSDGATDSLWFQPTAAAAFPDGVLLIRQGGQLAAIDWRDVARELRLDAACR